MSNILRSLDGSILTNALLSIIPALICITFHELSHGYVAYKLGDNTAKNMGRLTLNPIKHIDPFGLLMMVVARFGWAKPVPVNMMNFKNPKRGMAITALAGPLSNILLAVVILFIYGILYPFLIQSSGGVTALELIYITAYLSVALAMFNIIPIPPLDGSKILFSFLPSEMYYKLMRYERYGMIILMVIIVTGAFSGYLSVAVTFIFEKLFYIAEIALNLTTRFL